jgi:hypothetical protein
MVSYLATAILAVSVLAGTPQPVQWQADYGKALAETRAGDQPLLVVLDEPKTDEARVEPALLGEGEANTPDAELLHHYHLCHVDASTPYGKKVAGVFAAKRLPHMAIIDKSGSVILYSKSGKIARGEWRTALKDHQDGARPLHHVSYKLIGDSSESSSPVSSNPGYCPSCQRRSR